MAGAKISGVAVIFGFRGSVNYMVGAIAGLRNLFNESGEFSVDFQVDRIQDEENDYRTLIGSGELLKAKLLFTPRGGINNSITEAAAALNPPDMLSTVILGSAAGGGAVDFRLALANSSQWVYVGGWRVAFKKNGVATYELNIERSRVYNLAANVIP